MSKREPPAARRRRLSVDDRRDELLRVGMELFSTRAYDEIWVEEIADRAGVSRGLLYHYFPTKRDFYVAVNRAAAAEVRRRVILLLEANMLTWFIRLEESLRIAYYAGTFRAIC